MLGSKVRKMNSQFFFLIIFPNKGAEVTFIVEFQGQDIWKVGLEFIEFLLEDCGHQYISAGLIELSKRQRIQIHPKLFGNIVTTRGEILLHTDELRRKPPKTRRAMIDKLLYSLHSSLQKHFGKDI